MVAAQLLLEPSNRVTGPQHRRSERSCDTAVDVDWLHFWLVRLVRLDRIDGYHLHMLELDTAQSGTFTRPQLQANGRIGLAQNNQQ